MFLVAYDIADPRRLSRVARLLERYGLRLQKSVFLVRGSQTAVQWLLDQAASRMDQQEDVIQAWKLAQGHSPRGQCRGTPLPRRPAAVIVTTDEELYLEDLDGPDSQ